MTFLECQHSGRVQAKVDGVKALRIETDAELDAILLAIFDKVFKGGL
jgi:hypothetical protein